jgi:hypothetical protein
LRDVVPIAGQIRFADVVGVNPSLPVKSIPELIAYAKANPGALNFASSGIGSTLHVAGELFKMMTGVNIVQVPYRGGAPAMLDLIAGRAQVMFDNVPTSLPYIRDGKIGPLAVTAAARVDVLPELPLVPTMCRATRPARGTASLGRKARPPRSSTGSIARSTPSWPNLIKRSGSPISARLCCPAHRPISQNFSPTRPRNGAR